MPCTPQCRPPPSSLRGPVLLQGGNIYKYAASSPQRPARRLLRADFMSPQRGCSPAPRPPRPWEPQLFPGPRNKQVGDSL